MDGENNGKPYEQMDDLGGFYTPIFGLTPIFLFTKIFELAAAKTSPGQHNS